MGIPGFRRCGRGAVWAAVLLGLSGLAASQTIRLNGLDGEPPKNNTSKLKDKSHSHLTAAFNTGPRTQAKLLPGQGNAHFPITCQNPLVQKFFDQGLNQLYSFMYFEAERSFRQAAMLEPGNPMPFWGLAMNDSGQAPEFLKLANERMMAASERERRYIDALNLKYAKDGDREAKNRKYRAALEKIVLDYPDDIEAKLLLGQELYNVVDRGDGERSAVDALLRQVLEKNPMHPAANHFRIHLWDGPDAKAVLDSCSRYPNAAPNIGHAQHMPGHIYAQLGMWDKACYQMDAATRVERKYMAETRQMPFETWNYAHNQHYLIANLGYAGRIDEGMQLARELIDSPRDPSGNQDNDFSLCGEGRMAMLKMWLRGEKWDRILADEKAGWSSLPKGKSWRSFAKCLALIGTGNLEEAAKAVKQFEDDKPAGDAPKCALSEAKGRLLVAQGKFDEGIEELKKAAKIEAEKFIYNDPGPYPRPVGEALVGAYLAAQKPAEAEKSAKASLDHDPHNGFMLAQLALAQAAQGRSDEARKTADEFRQVFEFANPDLAPIKALREKGLLGSWAPKPFAPPRALAKLGPIAWQPFEMEDFELKDAEGKKVRLSQYRGKNIVLVFFLGGACEHCVAQLETFGKEKEEWDKLNVAVVGVSPDSTAELKERFGGNPKFPFPFLSDPDHRAAKLYKAYDEFENLELHTTVFITSEGKVWWFRTGSEPFSDMKFLKGEITRVNAMTSLNRETRKSP